HRPGFERTGTGTPPGSRVRFNKIHPPATLEDVAGVRKLQPERGARTSMLLSAIRLLRRFRYFGNNRITRSPFMSFASVSKF
ncbi:MAG TPA: hypothetical protein PKV75_12355, partial [Desulfobacterales bacterium]|nr:hypothetical protein [Desulfobacterales bacterium]